MTEQKKQFNQNMADAHTIIRLIGCEMNRIGSNAITNGADWSQVATIQHHRHQLKMVLSSMMGWDSEEEMATAIETAIEECRVWGAGNSG